MAEDRVTQLPLGREGKEGAFKKRGGEMNKNKSREEREGREGGEERRGEKRR